MMNAKGLEHLPADKFPVGKIPAKVVEKLPIADVVAPTVTVFESTFDDDIFIATDGPDLFLFDATKGSAGFDTIIGFDPSQDKIKVILFNGTFEEIPQLYQPDEILDPTFGYSSQISAEERVNGQFTLLDAGILPLDSNLISITDNSSGLTYDWTGYSAVIA